MAADPARWLRTYVTALRRAWTIFEPLWARSAGRMDREVERVSVALARGAGAELITTRFSSCALDGERLLLPSHTVDGGAVRVGGALQLQPLLAPPPAAGWTDDYGDLCLAIRYPVPGAWRAFEGEDPPTASLDALLGPHRARILAHLERGAATAGELARLLHGVPSIASHHVRALERAGLVARERDGRHVRVHRTARGTRLVELYRERLMDRLRDDLIQLVHRGHGVRDFSLGSARVLRRAVPFDGVCMITFDPASALPTGEVDRERAARGRDAAHGRDRDLRARLQQVRGRSRGPAGRWRA